MENALHRCLNPETVAVIGGEAARRAVRECIKFGFAGEIWAVNPGRDELEGLPCYDSVSSLPGVPDVALVAVPAEQSIEIVAELARLGAGGAVCHAAGFKEAAQGDRQERLVAAAGNMPIIGPNCYGYINCMNGAVMWPDWHGLSRVDSGVAIFTGSGNLSVNLTMQDRSVPLAMIVTIGNQAMIGVEQLIDSVIEDERITAVGIHIEGLRDLPQFVAVARRAAAAGKPIVAIKTGKSDTGARIAMSHTAILAGETDLYDTLFDRLGVAQVQDLECFLESLKLLSVVGPLPGRRIASMSCSGGEASLIADLVQDTSLEFPEIGPEQTRRLRETLNEYVGISNPLDYHTFIWGDQERLRQTFVAMLEGGYDLTLLLLDVPLLKPGELNEWAMACDAFADACEATGQRGAVVCSLAESMPTQVRDDLIARSIAPMLGMPQAIAAVQAAATAGHILEPVPQLPASAPMPASRHSVDECAAKKLLASHGLKTTGARVVSSTDAAQTTARELGFPLALKASIKGVNHKTEIDGIALNVASLEEVAVQGERLLNLGGDLLVERMVAPGIAELLLGVSYDAQFGHYLVLGCGGTLVELIADRQLLLLPASDTQIRQALERLRIAPLLAGYRGRPAADINAIVASVQGLTGLVVEQADRILEVDINPLIVAEEGGGATVADALIVYRTETHATTEEETNGERNHVQCS